MKPTALGAEIVVISGTKSKAARQDWLNLFIAEGIKPLFVHPDKAMSSLDKIVAADAVLIDAVNSCENPHADSIVTILRNIRPERDTVVLVRSNDHHLDHKNGRHIWVHHDHEQLAPFIKRLVVAAQSTITQAQG
jgi:hypothetical protein